MHLFNASPQQSSHMKSLFYQNHVDIVSLKSTIKSKQTSAAHKVNLSKIFIKDENGIKLHIYFKGGAFRGFSHDSIHQENFPALLLHHFYYYYK